MDVQTMKQNLHKQIDALNDEAALSLLHDAAVAYNSQLTGDVLDELTDDQQRRLQSSLAQAAEGKTIPHAEAMQLLSQWRKK